MVEEENLLLKVVLFSSSFLFSWGTECRKTNSIKKKVRKRKDITLHPSPSPAFLSSCDVELFATVDLTIQYLKMRLSVDI